jgi:agmatinase
MNDASPDAPANASSDSGNGGSAGDAAPHQTSPEDTQQPQFDPDAAAAPGTGVFGLDTSYDDAGIVILPVPFDATTSYGHGCAAAPGAIMHASHQVDLFDRQFGRIYEAGIFMPEPDAEISTLSLNARRHAQPIIAKGGAADDHDDDDQAALEQVEIATGRVEAYTYEATRHALAQGKVAGLVGGDHSTPLGAMRACAEAAADDGGTLGILQIDAHMDLRVAYEGFQHSHASIMHNALETLPDDTVLVQVGVRDFSEREYDRARALRGRVFPHFDQDWAEALDNSAYSFQTLCAEAIQPLPETVYVSVDIDGLDPRLCPGTGTPVPGGLTFQQLSMLLRVLARSQRRVVGFDLVEVSPHPNDGEWNANVGARVLYKLCGCAAISNKLVERPRLT